MAKDSAEKQPEAIPAVMAGTPEQEMSATPLVTEPAGEIRTSERREIAKSASLVMLGNLGSSIMGMVRQIVVVAIGSSVAGPFNSAILPAQTFNDFLINGSVSGALIPTFNDYSAPEKRDELRRIVFTIVNLVLIVMFVAAVLYALFAPYFIDFLVTGYKGPEKQLTLQYSQIIFFSLLALGPFAVLLAALYALKEFAWPAFATASYHVGIIIGAFAGSLLGARYYGHLGLAFGVLLGAAGEIALLLPGIRDQRLRYMFVLDLKHPALQRILKLYAPVALSFLVSMGIIFFDQHLASLTPGDGAANFTAMRAATTLIQFPVGLVAAALSFAVLPTLSAHAREGDMERFKATLLLGFRIGLLLMIPAAAGLIILRVPIVDLLFMHHKYTAQNAALTAVACSPAKLRLSTAIRSDRSTLDRRLLRAQEHHHPRDRRHRRRRLVPFDRPALLADRRHARARPCQHLPERHASRHHAHPPAPGHRLPPRTLDHPNRTQNPALLRHHGCRRLGLTAIARPYPPVLAPAPARAAAHCPRRGRPGRRRLPRPDPAPARGRGRPGKNRPAGETGQEIGTSKIFPSTGPDRLQISNVDEGQRFCQ